MFQQSKTILLAAAAAITVFSLTAFGLPSQRRQRGRADDAARHSREAADVFNEIMGVHEKAIPRELLEKAEAVAVFPGVLKAAFIVGGRGGQGVISRRTGRGWSEPAFFKMGGGSFGAQIGVEKTDYVLLVMNDHGINGLLSDKFEIGGEASVAAGPVGRTASASTNVTIDAEILSYSRSHGVFAGVSLKGAVIQPDNDLNQAFYGKTAREILMGGRMSLRSIPSVVRVFPETLERYTERASNHRVSTAGTKRNHANPPQSTAQIPRQVRHELLMLPNYNVFDWITFQLQSDGTVILRGDVISPPDTKSRAEAAVKDVKGVRRVINDIQLLPVSPMDDRLRQALYRAVYSGPLLHYGVGSLNTIHIIVKNGNATLEGMVNSTSDRQLAYVEASKVSGLFSLKNNLQVGNGSPR